MYMELRERRKAIANQVNEFNENADCMNDFKDYDINVK